MIGRKFHSTISGITFVITDEYQDSYGRDWLEFVNTEDGKIYGRSSVGDLRYLVDVGAWEAL